MAIHAQEHLFKMTKLTEKNHGEGNELSIARRSAATNCTVQHMLRGIHLIRVHDSTELLAIVNRLSSLIDQCGDVKLVIVDSIAFPFRQNLHDVATRTRILAGVASKLQQVAYEKNVAVVVTNHVTSKFIKAKPQKDMNDEKVPDDFDKVVENGDISKRDMHRTATELVPALGDTWSHAITNRLMMFFVNGKRCASLVKSSYAKSTSCSFLITEEGIRDHPKEKKKRDPNESSESNETLKKLKST